MDFFKIDTIRFGGRQQVAVTDVIEWLQKCDFGNSEQNIARYHIIEQLKAVRDGKPARIIKNLTS